MIQDTERRPRSFLTWFLNTTFTWLSIPLALVATTFALQGPSVAEKVATQIALPLGLITLICVISFVKAIWRRERSAAQAFLLVTLIIYAASAGAVSQVLVHSLESRYPPIDIDKLEPLDALVILGGGTSTAPDGRPQYGDSGDRLGLALQLYHRGIVKKLIVTGDALRGTANEVRGDPSIHIRAIFNHSGVQDDDMTEIEGTNTSEEIRALKKHPEWTEGKRCGLVTSAYHMPRAMKLAESHDLKLIPIAADYRESDKEFDVRDWLPSAGAMRMTEIALREYLGMLIGR